MYKCNRWEKLQLYYFKKVVAIAHLSNWTKKKTDKTFLNNVLLSCMCKTQKLWRTL